VNRKRAAGKPSNALARPSKPRKTILAWSDSNLRRVISAAEGSSRPRNVGGFAAARFTPGRGSIRSANSGGRSSNGVSVSAPVILQITVLVARRVLATDNVRSASSSFDILFFFPSPPELILGRVGPPGPRRCLQKRKRRPGSLPDGVKSASTVKLRHTHARPDPSGLLCGQAVNLAAKIIVENHKKDDNRLGLRCWPATPLSRRPLSGFLAVIVPMTTRDPQPGKSATTTLWLASSIRTGRKSSDGSVRSNGWQQSPSSGSITSSREPCCGNDSAPTGT